MGGLTLEPREYDGLMIIFLACVLFVLDIDLTHIPFILLFVCS